MLKPGIGSCAGNCSGTEKNLKQSERAFIICSRKQQISDLQFIFSADGKTQIRYLRQSVSASLLNFKHNFTDLSA